MNPRILTEVFLILLGVYCSAEGAINFSKGIPALFYGHSSTTLFYFIPSFAFLAIAMGLLRYANGLALKYFSTEESYIQGRNQSIQNWYILTLLITGFIVLIWIIPTVSATLTSHITLLYIDPIPNKESLGRSWQLNYFLWEGIGSIQIMIACGLIMGARRLSLFLCKMQVIS